MISLRNNFVFVHIPKTGGNSLQSILEPFSDDRRLKTAPFHDLHDTFGVQGPVTGRKHFTSADYIARLGYPAFMKLRKVTFVRDPLDRAASFYFSAFRWMRETPSGPQPAPAVFDKDAFLHMLPNMASATDCLSHEGRLVDFDVVGRFETYGRDVPRLLRACGLDPIAVPHVNRRLPHPPIPWDDDLLEAVQRRFAEDYRNFGYDPAPRQVLER